MLEGAEMKWLHFLSIRKYIYIFILIASTLSAQEMTITPSWLDFYGSIRMADGENALPGSMIQAYDPDGVLCGACLIRSSGRYGFLAVYEDDPLTANTDEGAGEGDLITFRLDGTDLDVVGSQMPIWSKSIHTLRIDLVEKGFAVRASLYEYWAGPGETCVVPVVLNELLDHDIYSADLKLSFDPAVLQAGSASTSGCIAQGWGDPTYDVKQNGQVWLSMAGASPLTESGTLVNVSFDVVGATGDSSSIHFIELTLNEGTPPVSLKDGIFHVGEWPTEVQADNGHKPNDFELHQNYPNPFNPETTIRFAIPKSSRVTLKLFDMLGKEVVVLVDERLEAGGHKVVFDAAGLVSGIYFYQIRTGGFVDTKRLVLMR